jgi:hypothetical protein
MKVAGNTAALGDIVDLIMGQAPSSKDTNFEGQGTPFVKVGEFGELRPVIHEWTTNPLRMARKTDVLLCVVGAGLLQYQSYGGKVRALSMQDW